MLGLFYKAQIEETANPTYPNQPVSLSGEYVLLDDIRYDIDNDIPKGKLFDWLAFQCEMSDYNVSYKDYLKMNQ